MIKFTGIALTTKAREHLINIANSLECDIVEICIGWDEQENGTWGKYAMFYDRYEKRKHTAAMTDIKKEENKDGYNRIKRRIIRIEERSHCQQMGNDETAIRKRVEWLIMHLEELENILETKDFR